MKPIASHSQAGRLALQNARVHKVEGMEWKLWVNDSLPATSGSHQLACRTPRMNLRLQVLVQSMNSTTTTVPPLPYYLYVICSVDV
jgi:hypothetical protein